MKVALTVVSILLLASFALAEVPLLSDMVTLDVNIRPRYEIDGKDFNSDTGLLDYGTLRTMVGINVMPNENLMVRVKFKESRLLGTQRSNNLPTASFQAQEAYLKLMNAFDMPLSVKAGRFEYWLGRKRIFGNAGFNVYGPRTYDGLKLHFNTNYGGWSLMAAKVVDYDAKYVAVINSVYDVNPPFTTTAAATADHNLFVLSGKLFDDHFQPLFSADLDNNKPVGQKDANHLYTAGFYYNRKLGKSIKFMLDGAYQFGNRNDRTLASYLVAADVYYMMQGRTRPYVGIGIDMTSGNKWDEDTPTDDDNVFYAPFMSRHAKRGYMDYFKDERRGLMDAMFHIGFKPENGVSVMLDVHNFAWANKAAYINGNGETVEYTQLGQELDLRSIIPVNENVNLDGGVSVFMPTDDWKPNGDMALFIYLAAIATF